MFARCGNFQRRVNGLRPKKDRADIGQAWALRVCRYRSEDIGKALAENG